MVTALSFRCTGCGNCCRTFRVAVTALDVARLAAALSRPAFELVTWLAPLSVDMAGEPDSFVELNQGRRLMVLRQNAGACSLLGADDLCSAYAARPRDCRAFPFDVGLPPARRLALLPLNDCEYAEDGQNDPTLLQVEDAERWRELRQYQALVAAWNRRAWHRRRLHRTVGDASEFLARALAPLTL